MSGAPSVGTFLNSELRIENPAPSYSTIESFLIPKHAPAYGVGSLSSGFANVIENAVRQASLLEFSTEPPLPYVLLPSLLRDATSS